MRLSQVPSNKIFRNIKGSKNENNNNQINSSSTFRQIRMTEMLEDDLLSEGVEIEENYNSIEADFCSRRGKHIKSLAEIYDLSITHKTM